MLDLPEVRRIQKFGKSTLMVSLPASWVKAMGLVAGDSISIEVMEDGTLRLAPLQLVQRKEEKRLKVKVSKGSSEALLTRSIMAGYLLGVDVITVDAMDGVLTETHLKSIRNVVKDLLGAEIIENTPSRITIQVLVDPSKYSAPNLLTRVINLVRFMLQHIQTALLDRKIYLLSEVLEMEKEVDRLHALAVRQFLQAQNDRSLAKHLGIKSSLIPEYRGIIKALEEAADALSSLVQILSEDHGQDIMDILRLNADLLKECLDYMLMVVDRLDKVFKTLDPYITNDVLNMISEYYVLIRKYDEMLFKSLKTIEATIGKEISVDRKYLHLREFIDKLIEVGRMMESAAESAFDISIDKTGEVLDISRVFL